MCIKDYWNKQTNINYMQKDLWGFSGCQSNVQMLLVSIRNSMQRIIWTKLAILAECAPVHTAEAANDSGLAAVRPLACWLNEHHPFLKNRGGYYILRGEGGLNSSSKELQEKLYLVAWTNRMAMKIAVVSSFAKSANSARISCPNPCLGILEF